MKKNTRTVGLIWGLFVLAAALPVSADVTLDTPVTWVAGDGGWTLRDGTATSILNDGSGHLRMRFNALGSPDFEEDAMVADNQAGYNGNYGAIPYLQVSFLFQGYASSIQDVYFESAGGDSKWSYTLDVPDSSWHSYSVSLAYSTGWVRTFGTEDFATAIAAVDMIGISVFHNNTGSTFDYYLDDWTFSDPVPEPGSIALLVSAFGSLGMVCRCRRRNKVAAVQKA